MFWLKRPTDIFENVTIVPNRRMSDDEIYNAISRLIIVVGIFLCLFSILLGLAVILIGLILTVFFWYCHSQVGENVRAIGNYTCEKRRRRVKKNVCEKCTKAEQRRVRPKNITILPRY